LRGENAAGKLDFMEDFTPPAALRNAHLMTLAAAFWVRRFPLLPPAEEREFAPEPRTRLMTRCHWQPEPRQHPTLLVVHGLEGSIESGYMLGTAEKAWARGFNVVLMNQRNCGGTESLTPTLYNSGLSGDVRAVLAERDALPEIFAAGFSMGGNLVLKMAGEPGAPIPAVLRGVAGVCPAIDLAAGAAALEEPRNFIYSEYFVRRLKRRYRYKVKLFPDDYALDGVGRVRTIREFDDVITARYSGYRDAADYYARASARQFLSRISVPALLLTAQDDPIVPFRTFHDPAIAANPRIRLDAPRHGGHCGFVASRAVWEGGDRFWAEERVVQFCLAHTRLAVQHRAVSQPSHS
jgi:uncharacterized protein